MSRPLIPWWSLPPVAVASIAIALCVACLMGCATDRELAMAYVQPGHVVKPAVYVYVADPHAACVANGVIPAEHAARLIKVGRYIEGCTDLYAKINARVATTILPFNAPADLREHEELHRLRGSWHK